MQPTFADVAKMIGDARLAKPLEQLARQVEIEVHNASFFPQPLAAEVGANFQRLRTATRRFEIALNQVSSHLLELPGTAATALPKAREAVSEILAMCNDASAPGKPGRRREPGKVTCALIVIEAWASVGGKAPSANNQDAQEACETYWQACGGQPSGNWQRTLKAARVVQSNWRQYIRDKIRQGAE
jgi:hypothetical protein